MMTAKINNGTTETQTRLVRWKRRVLGFEGADVTLYLPVSHAFLAHPSRMLGNRGNPPIQLQ